MKKGRQPNNQVGTTEPTAGGVVTRPPFLFLVSLMVAHILDHLLPLSFGLPLLSQLDPGEVHVLYHAVSGALIAVGLTILVAGLRNFIAAGTPVPSSQPASRLVTTGIHGRSRNPIYVGMFLTYAGVGVLLRSPWIFLFLLPLVIVMRYVVVAREESYLRSLFGASYCDYEARVRRWL